MRVTSSPSLLLVVGLSFLLWGPTRAEKGSLPSYARRPTEHVVKVLGVNDEGRPTVVTGDLGEVGMDSTHANDEIFRNNVKQQLTGLLQDQMGDDMMFADASIRDLETHGRSIVSKNGFSHIRFIQRVNGYPVEGASLMAHTDADGKIFLVNGEFLDGYPVPTKPLLDSQTAIAMAMKEASISKPSLRVQENLRMVTDDAELAMVRDEHDSVCFAWKILLDYVEVHKDDTRKHTKAFLYANTQNGRLCGLHPQVFDLDPIILRTYACTPNSLISQLVSINNMDCTYLYSDSHTTINSTEAESALDAAHNNALATYQYYKAYHDLASFDDRSTPVKSYVLSPEFKYEGAYWDRGSLVLGDGIPGSTNPYSFGIDVVAHEFVRSLLIFCNITRLPLYTLFCICALCLTHQRFAMLLFVRPTVLLPNHPISSIATSRGRYMRLSVTFFLFKSSD
jgi:bacillolysin